jgi:hypothetical protein
MKSTRIRIAVVATAALLALTACSDEPDPTPAPPTPTESTSTTEDPTPTETPTDGETTPTETPTLEVDPTTGQTNFCEKQTTPFTGSAPEVFGQENVKDAYCEMGDLMIQQSFISNLVRAEPGDKIDPRQFSVPRDYMTDDALKDWDAAVKGGDYADIWGIMFYKLYSEDYSYYPEGSSEPTTMNLKVSPARTGVDKSAGDDRLLLRFTVSADLNVSGNKDEKAYLFPVSKDVSMYLVNAPGDVSEPHNWYIDGWNSKTKFGTPYLRPELTEDDSNSN